MAEPLNATFFALKRRDRSVLLPATVVFVALMALIIAAFVALNWSTLVQLRDVFLQAGQGGQVGEGQALRLVSGMFALIGMTFLFLFPVYITIAAYEAACLRWMIRGEAPGLFGITIDNDVWRVWGIYWCWLLAQFAVSSAMSILTMPLVLMSMPQIMQDPTPEGMMRWQLSVQLPIMLLQYIPLIFVGVRFAPAAATSILRRKFSVLEAWEVTRGRFWPLLGSFALLWLIAAAVTSIAAIPFALHMWPYFSALWPAPTDEAMQAYFEAYFNPRTLIWVVAGYGVMTITGLWLSVMSYGVNARAAMVAMEEGKIKPAE